MSSNLLRTGPQQALARGCIRRRCIGRDHQHYPSEQSGQKHTEEFQAEVQRLWTEFAGARWQLAEVQESLVATTIASSKIQLAAAASVPELAPVQEAGAQSRGQDARLVEQVSSGKNAASSSQAYDYAQERINVASQDTILISLATFVGLLSIAVADYGGLCVLAGKANPFIETFHTIVNHVKQYIRPVFSFIMAYVLTYPIPLPGEGPKPLAHAFGMFVGAVVAYMIYVVCKP